MIARTLCHAQPSAVDAHATRVRLMLPLADVHAGGLPEGGRGGWI
jgi:hypothetical protein